ncbi:hypothetical protein EOM57_04305 [Candidatus Saccharibacteria bacterium]|nr:hypothetical protein [Candidatus Saccharibacteria bacterium]
MKYKITPTDPPKLQNPYGGVLGMFAAAVSIFFAVIHLFRIDMFVPLVDSYMLGGIIIASLKVVAVVLAEVFAVPFALRMKLSPLAHRISGALLVFAPLYWTLVTIWNYDTDVSTGQFSSFVETPSGLMPIVLNLTWLVFTLATLWALGYGTYKLPERRKLH